MLTDVDRTMLSLFEVLTLNFRLRNEKRLEQYRTDGLRTEIWTDLLQNMLLPWPWSSMGRVDITAKSARFLH